MYNIVDERDKIINDNNKQAKYVMIRLLKILHNICERNNLSYWLEYGSLLGAVRHNGFIPWDDDIDVGMTRNDFNKFLEIAKQELPKDVLLQFGKNSRKKWKWIKLRDINSTFIQKSEINKKIKYHQGIFIDIFAFDETDENLYIKKLILNRMFHKSNLKLNKLTQKIFNIISTIIVKIVGYNNLRKIFLRKSNIKEHKYISDGIDHKTESNIFIRSDIFPLKKISFENDLFYVPNNYLSHLEIEFGNNYMTLPPIEQRKSHAYIIKPTTKYY